MEKTGDEQSMTQSRTEDSLKTEDASSLGRHVKLDMETRLGFGILQDSVCQCISRWDNGC